MKKILNKKLVVWLSIISIIIVFFGISIYFVINKKDKDDGLNEDGISSEEKDVFGVWWWNDELDSEKYLDFADENKISEVYYCDSSLNESTLEFANLAKERNIKVYLLAGEKEWLNDKTNLDTLIERYIDFQNQNNNPLAGIHLDIEPHQFGDFDEKREGYVLKLIELADYLNKTYSDILFDYDIPFWLDDEIYYNSETKPAFKHIIDIANRVFVMSYRDTAEKIYDVGKDEIQYAESISKPLFLCVETYSSEGDSVSFFEEGKDYMNQELEKLREKLKKGHGISVHHIKTWYDLKQ